MLIVSPSAFRLSRLARATCERRLKSAARGVFDVPESAAGDVLVRIDPRLPISRATAFAITVERPGGMVVSSRE